MTDDQGYGVSSTFGGVIPTPSLDRVARSGLRFTEFNSTALCSPSHAALITGRNHHKFRWEAPEPLKAGAHTIIFDFVYAGPGIGKGGTGTLRVDGEIVSTHQIPNTIAFLMVADESFNIGADTGTPVNGQDYQVPLSSPARLQS